MFEKNAIIIFSAAVLEDEGMMFLEKYLIEYPATRRCMSERKRTF
jgi:hypothetical protein